MDEDRCGIQTRSTLIPAPISHYYQVLRHFLSSMTPLSAPNEHAVEHRPHSWPSSCRSRRIGRLDHAIAASMTRTSCLIYLRASPELLARSWGAGVRMHLLTTLLALCSLRVGHGAAYGSYHHRAAFVPRGKVRCLGLHHTQSVRR